MTVPLLHYPLITQQGNHPISAEAVATGVYPEAWDFAYDATEQNWGASPRMYSALAPWGRNTTEASTTWGMRAVHGELHHGWSQMAGAGTMNLAVPPVYDHADAINSAMINQLNALYGVATGNPPPSGARFLVRSPAAAGFAWQGESNAIATYTGSGTQANAIQLASEWSFAHPDPPAGATTGGSDGNGAPWNEGIPFGSTVFNQAIFFSPAFGQWLQWDGTSWIQFVHGFGPYTLGVGSRVASAYVGDGGTYNEDDIYHFSYALHSAANVEVSNTFTIVKADGAPLHPKNFSWAGVGARIRGGSWVGGGDDSATGVLEDCDGYWVYLAKDGSTSGTTDWSWLLCRVNAGVLTVLDEMPTGVPPGANTHDIDELHLDAGGRKLKVRVVNEGADVRITAWNLPRLLTTGPFGGPGGGPTGVVPDPEIQGQIFDFLDTAAGKITGAGLCGFALGQGRNTPTDGFRFRILSSGFDVYDVDTASYVIKDSWQRVLPDHNLFLIQDAVQNTGMEAGTALSSVFGGDAYSSGFFQYRLDRDSASDRLEAPGVTGTEPGWHLWTLPPSSIYTQRRSMEFETTAGFDQWCGVFLRGDFNPTPLINPGGVNTLNRTNTDGKTCYLAVVQKVSGLFKLHLWHYNRGDGGLGSGVQTTMTGAGVDVTSLLADGTPFTLDIQARNFPDTQTGNVYIDVRLDSGAGLVSQPLVADTAGVPGVFNQGNTVIDSRSIRATSGQNVGFYMRTASSISMFGDNWAAPAWAFITTPPGDPDTGVPEQDQLSIVLESEGDDASGSLFSIAGDWPISVRSNLRVDRREFDSAHIQTQAVDARLERRVWTLRSDVIVKSTLDAILAFFNARGGIRQTFLWDTPHPENERVTVHFKDPELGTRIRDVLSGTQPFGTNTHWGGFSFDLEEIRTL